MTDTERLDVLRRHISRAQDLLSGFIAPSAGQHGLRLEDFLRELKHELNHWEITSALRRESDTSQD
jgi:hypothetical protein